MSAVFIDDAKDALVRLASREAEVTIKQAALGKIIAPLVAAGESGFPVTGLGLVFPTVFVYMVDHVEKGGCFLVKVSYETASPLRRLRCPARVFFEN